MDFDVAIVGAGPAGSSAALHLLRARPGTRIALLDRARLPRDKPCGGAVSRAGLEVLEAIDATPTRLGVASVPIHAIRVRYRTQARERALDGDAPPLARVVWRAAFDAALAREAARRGADLEEDARLVALERGPNGLRLEVRSAGGRVRVLRARLVVGADGTGSAVRRLAGFDEEGPRARLLVAETDGAPDDDVLRSRQGDVEPEGGRGVLEFDLTALDGGFDGYLWHFATMVHGRAAVSRGVYDFRARRPLPATQLRSVLERVLCARGLDPRAAHLKPYTERLFVSPDAPLALRRGVLLAGEAAGLVDPITGEGIAQALASGRVAAQELARALAASRSEPEVDPARYRAALAGLPFHRHLHQSRRLSAWVYGSHGWLWADGLVGCASAVHAGCDWYVEKPLGPARVASVGLSLAASFARASWRRLGDRT